LYEILRAVSNIRRTPPLQIYSRTSYYYNEGNKCSYKNNLGAEQTGEVELVDVNHCIINKRNAQINV